MSVGKIELKLDRWDRDPGGDHNYGDTIDQLLVELVGGPDKFDMSADHPSATVKNSSATVELHEDGPLILFVIAQIPAILSAVAALVSAWIAWKATRTNSTEDTKRTVIIRSGNHKYEGRPTSKEQLEKILNLFEVLD